jgi:hypothetical protein
MPLTDKNGGYLIERYSIFATHAYRGIEAARDEENGHSGEARFPGDRHHNIAREQAHAGVDRR